MSVSLSTIGDMFSQPTGPAQVGLRPDAPAKDARFSPVHEHSQPPADATQPETPPRAPAEAPSQPGPEGRKDFREVIDKQTKPGKPAEPRDHSEPTQKNAESRASDQTNVSEIPLAQNPVAVEQGKKGTAPTIEPKTQQQLAQLIDGAKTQNARPVVAETATSAEIKISATATSKKSGFEAVSPDALKNVSATVASTRQAKSADALPMSNNATADVKAVPKGGDAKQLAPEAPVVSAVKTATAGKEQVVPEDSAVTVPMKTPVVSTGAPTDQIAVESSTKATNAGANTANTAKTGKADAGQVPNPRTEAGTAVQPAPAQPSAPNTGKIVPADDALPADPEKLPPDDRQEPLPTAEPDADATVQQPPTRPTGPIARKFGQHGNNIENPVSNTVEIQTPAVETEAGGNQGSEGNPLPDSAQILSQTTTQPAAAEQGPAFAVEARAAGISEQTQTTPAETASSISNQVLESVRSSLSQQTGDKEITIQLHPPELGKVSVKFQEQGSEITGTLEVTKAQTRTEIEQALPEMIRSLADSGVAIKHLEVVLSDSDQSGQHTSKDPLLQDSAFQQRNSAHPGQSGDQQQAAQTYYGPTGRNRYQYQNAADPYEMQVTNTSINMLA